MRPVCNRFNYYDGRCVAVNGYSTLYFSLGNWRTFLTYGLSLRSAANTYWYTSMTYSYFNTGTSHRQMNKRYDSGGGYERDFLLQYLGACRRRTPRTGADPNAPQDRVSPRAF